MENLNITPYAVKIMIRPGRSIGKVPIRRVLPAMFKNFAERCTVQGNVVIGHIKGFAKDPNGGWLGVSIVDALHAPGIQGEVADFPEQIELTVNAHVIGLDKRRIEAHLLEALAFANLHVGIDPFVNVDEVYGK